MLSNTGIGALWFALAETSAQLVSQQFRRLVRDRKLGIFRMSGSARGGSDTYQVPFVRGPNFGTIDTE